MAEVIALILGGICAALGYYAWRLRQHLQQKQYDLEGTRKAMDAKARAEQELGAQVASLRAESDSLRAEIDRRGVQQAEASTSQAVLSDELESLRGQAAYERALTLTLANAAYDALIVVDREQQIIGINDSAEVLFGVDDPLRHALVEVTGVPELGYMVDDALRNEEDSFEEQIVINRRNYRVQVRFVRRDGHDFVGLALQDITRLVRLNRARRDMVANISHELRHPIANIRITIDSLFHEQDKPKRKDTIASLRAIARETDALMWLVQEMSDLAMIESGQAIVRMVNVPIAELVDEAIERIEEQSQFKNLSVVRHLPEKLNVLCDRDLARRVLINLLHNAVKWSPDGEAITVSAVSGEDEVTISVFDNGPGVPDDKVERIFERFYQVDDSRSRGDGTGLGLAICRHIVEAHGGRIWAEGNGKGSGGRFLFTLLSGEDAPSDDDILPEPQHAPDSNS